MVIGINASSALKKNPTGVEEYTFQIIKHLAMIPESKGHRFVLYFNRRLKSERLKEFEKLPENFEIKFLSFPLLWTQIRLAWEMVGAKIDVLFIPVHTLPAVRPKKTVVTLHGLEYEFYPETYPFLHRQYLRWSTKYALRSATTIISVSENTKNDLIKLYGGGADKIKVIHHGVNFSPTAPTVAEKEKYLLYIGRLETKKNILGIIEAYNRLRADNAAISAKLMLAGHQGFGFSAINKAIKNSRFREDIIIKGYVSEAEKTKLLKGATAFLFPSFYEGFGMPVLEAQSCGVPVITSNTSCLPEIAGKGAAFVDPHNYRAISAAMERVLIDSSIRDHLVQAGFENVKKFSWEKCARETLGVILS